ncbi:1951_t:CDS:2 [Scutellospora calospora]|uniref:1951_t:CDS:1 n=1 Tax=Scutellospora calospora TaxID=85575 RepID=A0ACA9LAF2_9GLOM|nr:1951_t:CDS:2 [Scutellospora calospora]
MLEGVTRKKPEGTIDHNYPHNNLVFWKSNNGNYNYIITNLGILPLNLDLKYIQNPGLYPIPNNYKVEVFWERKEKNHIQASIDYIKNNPKLKEIVLEADQFNILRRGYRALTVNSQNLPKEWLISKEKHKIDKIMQKHIPLLEFDMTQLQNDDSDDSDELDKLDSEKITNTLKKGDGRNVRRKIKHVIVTLAVLNDQENLMKPENHYTISLFSGTENYTSLKIALKPIHHELQQLCHIHPPELALNECKNNRYFVNEMRELICEEMSTIKLKIIEKFNLNIMLLPARAIKVQKLWLGFYELYKMLSQNRLTGNQFCNKALEWLDMFLTPS